MLERLRGERVDTGRQDQCRLTASIGVAELTAEVADGPAFLALAAALYQSKRGARDRVTVSQAEPPPARSPERPPAGN